jgi:hypothetical protein
MDYEAWKQQEELRKFRQRRKLRAILKKYKPKKRKSVQTISGGLPSLGKRR